MLFACRTNPSGGKHWLWFPAAFASTLKVHSIQMILRAPTVTSAPQYLPGATADIVLDPISNKTRLLTVCFVFNKSARQYPHILVALRMGIYHSTTDQIWHTSSCVGNSCGGYIHTVDLLT